MIVIPKMVFIEDRQQRYDFTYINWLGNCSISSLVDFVFFVCDEISVTCPNNLLLNTLKRLFEF